MALSEQQQVPHSITLFASAIVLLFLPLLYNIPGLDCQIWYNNIILFPIAFNKDVTRQKTKGIVDFEIKIWIVHINTSFETEKYKNLSNH